jgi:hypothetical protein
MIFLQYIVINLVLTKSSGLKSHAVLLTELIFAGFCVSHRSWWGGPVAIAPFPPPPAVPPPPNLSLNRPSLTAVGRFAHKFVGNSAYMP